MAQQVYMETTGRLLSGSVEWRMLQGSKPSWAPGFRCFQRLEAGEHPLSQTFSWLHTAAVKVLAT